MSTSASAPCVIFPRQPCHHSTLTIPRRHRALNSQLTPTKPLHGPNNKVPNWLRLRTCLSPKRSVFLQQSAAGHLGLCLGHTRRHGSDVLFPAFSRQAPRVTPSLDPTIYLASCARNITFHTYKFKRPCSIFKRMNIPSLCLCMSIRFDFQK